MLLLVAVLVLAAPVPKPKASGFDLRDSNGTVLVSATDISRYDWDTHTLTVTREVKAKLEHDSPTEFTASLHGKAIYRGKFWRATADEPCPGPVILLGDTPGDQIRIDFNYGGIDPRTEDDTRRDPAVRKALAATDKLK